MTFREELNKKRIEVVKIVDTNTEEHILGHIINLGKKIKDEECTEAMVELALITRYLGRKEDGK